MWLDVAAHDSAGRDDTSVPHNDTRQQNRVSSNPAPIADPDRGRHLLSTAPLWPVNVMRGGDDRDVVTDGHAIADNDVGIEVDMERRREKTGASDRQSRNAAPRAGEPEPTSDEGASANADPKQTVHRRPKTRKRRVGKRREQEPQSQAPEVNVAQLIGRGINHSPQPDTLGNHTAAIAKLARLCGFGRQEPFSRPLRLSDRLQTSRCPLRLL